MSVLVGSAVLAGTGSINQPAASIRSFLSASMAGQGSFAGAAPPIIKGVTTVPVMAGAGGIRCDSFIAQFLRSQMFGQGHVNAVATMPNMGASAVIPGTGLMLGQVTGLFLTGASLHGVGGLTYWFRSAWQASALLQGAGSFSAILGKTWPIGGTISGQGGFSPNAFSAQFIGASIGGAGGISVDDSLLNSILSLNAALSGEGGIFFDAPAYSAHYGIGAQLMYRASSGMERAMADVDAERITAIPAELIKAIWDPYACPFNLLGYLAWAMGVTYWNSGWSETTKRNWIAAQWLFKSLRGTKAGLEMAVDYSGRDVSPFGYRVTHVTRRPQQVFSGPALSKEQREAWLKTLPQVRVYYYRGSGLTGPNKAFIGGTTKDFDLGNLFFPVGQFMVPSIAVSHLSRRATWNVNGVDTDVPVVQYGSIYQLRFPSVEDSKVFTGRCFDLVRYFIPSDAWTRIYTIEPNRITPWQIPVGPTLPAISAQPDFVQIPGVRGLSVYSGSNYVHGGGSLMDNHNYFIPSTAYLRVFDRYAVNTGTTYLPRPNVQFMGVGRYGFPKFTAWADTLVTGIRPRAAASGETIMIPKAHYWIPHDPVPMQLVTSAAEASRRLADKIMLHTGPQRRFIAGYPFIVGIDSYVVNVGSRSLLSVTPTPDLTYQGLIDFLYSPPPAPPIPITGP